LQATLSTTTGGSQLSTLNHPLFRMKETQRLWLMFPTKLITRPIIWELGKDFNVVTNIRQASVTDEIGIVSLSLEGEREDIKKAIAWLEKQGVKVEPVEINTIEG
jgi:ABC-type methionine transport system ATPase subunit